MQMQTNTAINAIFLGEIAFIRLILSLFSIEMSCLHIEFIGFAEI